MVRFTAGDTAGNGGFSYVVSDGRGGTDTARVSVAIEAAQLASTLTAGFDDPDPMAGVVSSDLAISGGTARAQGQVRGLTVFETAEIGMLENPVATMRIRAPGDEFEGGGSTRDYVRVTALLDNGNEIVLDAFEYDRSIGDFIGQTTGQRITGEFTTLSWDLPSNAQTAQLRVEAHVTARDELIEIDQVEIESDAPGTMIDWPFAEDTNGFEYADDTFGGEADNVYAEGEIGSLAVKLGGVDGNRVEDISGGWSRDFTIDEATSATLTVVVSVSKASAFEADEKVEVLIGIDDRVIRLPEDVVLSDQPQEIVVDLGPLEAGEHTVSLGGFLNKKTQTKEEAVIIFESASLEFGDPVEVITPEPSPEPEPAPTPAPTPTPDGIELLNAPKVYDGRTATVVEHEEAFEVSSGLITIDFNASSTNNVQTLFSKDSNGKDDGGHLTLSLDNGQLSLRAQTVSESLEATGGTVRAGQDNTVTIAWEDGDLALGLNGQVVDTVSGWTGLGPNLEPIVIGASQARSGDGVADNLESYFTGEISSVTFDGEPTTPPTDGGGTGGGKTGDGTTDDDVTPPVDGKDLGLTSAEMFAPFAEWTLSNDSISGNAYDLDGTA
ncbi:MAG: hypothetical protein AAFZ09_07320, partial [Pseudomonadota bacterium]